MENELMDQYLENRQNYMIDNNSIQQLNVASADDGVVGVQSEVVSGVPGEILGGKYDENHEEHDVGDDDELKYVEEVQQSEKQQQQQLQTLKNIGLDDDGTYESNELAEKETANNDVHEFGNGNGGFVFGGDHHIHEQQPHHDLFNIGNGHDTNGHDIANINDAFDSNISTGFEEKLNLMESELGAFKNEGDFSSTSNVTEPAEGFVPQIDVKIETKVEQQEVVDEEEPSSLATNTTNGTSSLSENIPPQVNIDAQANAFDNLMAHLEDKENSDPLIQQRPNDLDLDQAQYQLNPDAKEFIPNFGSNPASPTSPFPSGTLQTEPVLSEIMETQMYFGQAASVVPRHLVEDDDFVAQSPCKGKDDNDMETVLVPRELSEFEEEADKRPHELESEVIEGFIQREEVMTPDQAIQQLPLDDIETLEKDSTDFQPSSFMDHGPETCVDHEIDLDGQSTTALPFVQGDNDVDDVMKRSIYIASDDAVQDILNSVQPIPSEGDSANNSFIEESATESAANQLAGDKELLQVEEKEHVSHSPSTEEIQLNLQNNLSSSNKDIPQLPVDMQECLFGKQEQNLLPEHEPEQNENFTSKNPFEQEDILLEQQPTVQAEVTEQHFLLQDESKPDDTNEFENKLLVEENLNEEENCEIAVQHNEQFKQDPLSVEDPIEQTYANELTTNNLIDTESTVKHHHYDDDDVNETSTPVKITDDITNTNVFESLNNEAHEEQLQQPEISNIYTFESLEESPANLQQSDSIKDDITQSFTADEKHLHEETKEQQLFSVSGLEQQMSALLLNNTDGDVAQICDINDSLKTCLVEEVADITATAAIEDILDNLINSDESTGPEEQQYEQQAETEPEKTEHLTLVDDSFNRHEQECLREYEEEQKEQEIVVVTEIKTDDVHETLETSAEQQHQEELTHELIVPEESITETYPATTILQQEETEIETEEKTEIPICVDLLEPIITVEHIETETEKQPELQFEEVKPDIVQLAEPVELKVTEAETVKEDVVAAADTSAEIPTEAVLGAAAVAVATTAVVAAKAATSSSASKKSLTKATTTTSAKSKVTATTAAKKPVEAAKKPVAPAAKPRTALAKPTAGTVDKKTTTTTTTLANRKPTTTSRVVAKTTTTTTTARTLTAAPKTTTTSKPTTTTSKPTTTTRTLPSSTSTARKTTTANGTLAKPRPGSAPAKPTTLGLPATNGAPKTKTLSPRPTLTSQVRKTAPATTAAKSPAKTVAAGGVTKTTTSTLASRTKTTTSTVSSTAGTAAKPFTARPAPKFTSATNTTTTTKRLVASATTTSSTTTNTIKGTSSPLRKSTPSKPLNSKTPTKSTTGALKSKTPTKTATPEAKPAPIRKPVDKTSVATAAAAAAEAVVSNGEDNAAKQFNGLTEKELNGDKQAVQQQNADSSIPKQTENVEQPFLETRDEQIPMDVINA